MEKAKLHDLYHLYTERKKQLHWPGLARIRTRTTRPILLLLLLLFLYFLLFRVRPAIKTHYNSLPLPSDLSFFDLTTYPYPTENLPSVTLVVATTSKDNISWTTHLSIPNLRVIRYISDSSTAPYHPAIPYKGREALIYLTYLHDYYHSLSDITIFTHASPDPWHIDSTLLHSLPFALTHLDLSKIFSPSSSSSSSFGFPGDGQREYFNLRTSWKFGCPDWIEARNETWHDIIKPEQEHMAAAMRDLFGNSSNSSSSNDGIPGPHNNNKTQSLRIPKILASPCCSQFAVTRHAIHRRSLPEYSHYISWFGATSLPDSTTGRIWERLWPWVFLQRKARDCVVEEKALCDMYGVCFARGREGREKFEKVWEERRGLEEKFLKSKRGLWREVFWPREVAGMRVKWVVLTEWLRGALEGALERGRERREWREREGNGTGGW